MYIFGNYDFVKTIYGALFLYVCMYMYIRVCVGYQKVSNEYAVKITSGTSMANTLHQLAGNIDEISHLIETGRQACAEMQCLLDILESTNHNRVHASHRVCRLKNVLCDIVKRYYYRHRTAGTHPRKQRPRCAELLSGLVSGRATLPVAGSRSIRMTINSLPLQMPPSPPPPPPPPPPGAHHHSSICIKQPSFTLLLPVLLHVCKITPSLCSRL